MLGASGGLEDGQLQIRRSRFEQHGRAGGLRMTHSEDVAGGTPVPTKGEDGASEGGASIAGRIAGLSVLKGLVVYGATLTFAGLYAYFMEEIVTAASKTPPDLNGAMVSGAAALAGVLGSAFALIMGVPIRTTNEALARDLAPARDPDRDNRLDPKKLPTKTRLRRALSLEPGGTDQPSWPQTFGVWMYAAVASAVAIVYVLNQAETPDAIKALAVAFGGYVIALMTAAYGLGSGRGR